MAKRSRKKKARPPHPSSPARGRQAWLARIWEPVLLALLAFLVYLPSLHSDFVYDARVEILKEGFITSLSNLPAVLSLQVLGMPHLMLGPRPGQLLYLMLIAGVCGKEPFGYHLCSNLLHAVNVALLFILLRRLMAVEMPQASRSDWLKARLAAVTVTLLFALHPLAVESVSEVSFSSSLLVTFFTLLALLVATKFPSGSPRAVMVTGIAGTFLAFAAVASKESGIAAALLLIVYWFLFRRREARKPWLLFLGAAATVTGLFLAARFLCAPGEQDPLTYVGGSFLQAMKIQPQLWVFMMGKIVWPMQLSVDYTVENVSVIYLPLAWGILLAVVGLQAALACRSRLGAFGMAVYWLGLAAVSNLLPLYRPVADRFYYLPLAGVAMQLLALLLMMLKWRWGFWPVLTLLLGLLFPLTLLTQARQAVFANEILLWGDTVKVSPYSSLARSNLGVVLLQAGEVHESIEQDRKALEIDPRLADVHTNLGNGLMRIGQTAEAVSHFQKALEIDPKYVEAYNSLGIVFSKKGEFAEAIDQFQKGLKVSTSYDDVHTNLALALLQTGKVDDAIEHFLVAEKMDSSVNTVHYGLGLALTQKGQLDDAIEEFQEALRIDPNIADVHTGLGVALLRKGEKDLAIEHFQRALQLNPGDAEARNHLAQARAQPGR